MVAGCVRSCVYTEVESAAAHTELRDMYKPARFARFVLPFTLAMLVAQASNMSGKWAGLIVIDDTASGTKIETPVELHLQQKDGGLSGKIGQKNNSDQVE